MISHFNALSEAEQERLAIVIEECGEVIQAACKVLRHGYASVNPTIPDSETNREGLEREIGDLQHAIARLEVYDVSRSRIDKCLNSKPERIKPYLNHKE